MELHQGHRTSLFSKTYNNQPDNSQKPLFMTPKSGHSEKQSTVSMFSNSSHRPFAPTRSSMLVENAVSRDLADSSSSLHLSGFKFNTTTSRSESRAPGSPSFQHSSSFYDTKGGFSARVRCIYPQADFEISNYVVASQRGD